MYRNTNENMRKNTVLQGERETIIRIIINKVNSGQFGFRGTQTVSVGPLSVPIGRS